MLNLDILITGKMKIYILGLNLKKFQNGAQVSK